MCETVCSRIWAMFLCSNCYVLFDLFQLVDELSHMNSVKKAYRYLYYTLPDPDGVRIFCAAGSGSVLQIRIQIQSRLLKKTINEKHFKMSFSSTFFDYFFVKVSLAFYDFINIFCQNAAFWTKVSGAWSWSGSGSETFLKRWIRNLQHFFAWLIKFCKIRI